MKKNLRDFIIQGNYKKAEEICHNKDMIKISDAIVAIAYDTSSMSVYSFMRYMIEKTKDISWMELAIEVMIHPLCFIEGAYSIALFHAREILSMQKSLENLERILFFYNIPEKLICKKEALVIADTILNIQPDNEIALEVKNSNNT